MKLDKTLNRKPFVNWWGYLLCVGVVVLGTLLGYVAQPFLTLTDTRMLYLLCVVVAAIFWGLGPSILASVLGVLGYDFFFVAPYLSFGPPNIDDIPPLIVMLLVGVIISYLTSRVRWQTEEAERHEKRTQALYILSRNLAATDELEVSAHAIMKSVKETLGHDVLLFLPGAQNNKMLKPYPESIEATSSENGIAPATWCFQHQKRAGQGTDIFPDAKVRYTPLITVRGTVGVMALSLHDATSRLTAQQERLVDAFADLAAVAIERIAFAEEARNMKISQAATEKLQTALLDSISHDLSTPLSSVIGVLSSLQEEGSGLDNAAKKNLIQVAYGEAEQLNNSITNLLDVSRIQAGAITISAESCDLNDIISVALDQLGDRLRGRTIRVPEAAELPFVSADFGLIVKVLLNLIDNALKYSSPDSPIEISARQVDQEVEIEVADRGIGIPPQYLPYIFERFHRVLHTGVPGLGLGLSICKGIVEAHGGRISAENRHGGGTIIRVTLPVAEVISANEGERDER